ncbi:MAG: cadherin-like domain-containing protein [Opitutales bacterium]|nr:cadherin-like domain-containing protein [Opitutales bacterium]
MNSFVNWITRWTVCSAILIFPALLSGSVPLVQWGPSTEIVSGFRNDTSARKDTVLSLATPSNPAVGANYYPDSAGASPVFFATAHNSENETANHLQIANDLVAGGTPWDVVRFNFDAGAVVANDIYCLIVWTRYGSGAAGSPVFGFLNGGDDNTANVVLTGLSARGFVNTNTGVTAENRFVIRINGNFYVSEDLGGFQTSGQGANTLLLSNPSGAQWFAYDPLADVRAIGSAATPPSFAGIDAVGLLAVRQSTQRYNTVQLVEFTATGIVGTGENTAPTAVDDTAETISGGTVLIPVLANDSDPDGDPLSIESVTTPTVGSAVIQGSLIAYTAPGGFTGEATFSYTISDGRGGEASATVTVTVSEPPPPPPPPPAVTLSGRDYRIFFIGNSLTRGLPVASRPDRAMLHSLFAARGDRLFAGVQMGAAVNLDEHWVKTRLSTGAGLQLNHLDDRAEVTLTGADWQVDPAPYGQSFFRDYRFALQGLKRSPDGTIRTDHTFDGVVLQTFQSFLETNQYGPTEQAKGFRGDRAAINDFIAFASGGNPVGHVAARTFYVYVAWPYLGSMEARALDPDGDGVFSFSEFWDQPYSPATNPPNTPAIGQFVPSRAYMAALFDAVAADNSERDVSIRLIPVGEVLALLDERIRHNQLPGVEAYFVRNADHFLEARLNGLADLAAAGFPYIYPPFQPGAFTSDFVRAQGVKNFYADHIHMNDQPHNDERAGTIGAYVSAATVQAVLTGEHPGLIDPEAVAAAYTFFDAEEDRDLIIALQDAIWSVVSTDPRTGVIDLPAEQLSYGGYAEARFSEAELADRTVSGPAADPDGNGLANGLDYFFQKAPGERSAAPSLRLQEDGADFSFTGLSRAVGLHPRVAYSTDLENWRFLRPRDFSRRPVTADPAMAEFSATLPTGGDPVFVRLALDFYDGRPQEDLVVWGPGGDIVSSFPTLVAGNGASAVNLNTPANPSVGGSYSTTSPVFFAAARALSGNRIDNYRISNGGENEDTLRVAFNIDGAAENNGVFTVIWQQAGDGQNHGFLNGADVRDDVRLGSILLRGKLNAASLSATETRFIVRLGEAFYISDSRSAITAQTFFEEVWLRNPVVAEWFHYDPADHAVIGEPAHIEDFTGVTAVGFSFRTFGAGGYQSFDMAEFRATFFNE